MGLSLPLVLITIYRLEENSCAIPPTGEGTSGNYCTISWDINHRDRLGFKTGPISQQCIVDRALLETSAILRLPGNNAIVTRHSFRQWVEHLGTRLYMCHKTYVAVSM